MYYSDMQGKRLDYIDAMRGVAILFVVFGHIPMYCYGIANEHLSSFRALTSLLQMPMFFFVRLCVESSKNVNGGGENVFFKVQTTYCSCVVIWRNICFHKRY